MDTFSFWPFPHNNYSRIKRFGCLGAGTFISIHLSSTSFVFYGQILIESIFSGGCVMVSANGTDDPICLKFAPNISCKTLSYPLSKGYTSVCIYGTVYNMTESIKLVYSLDDGKGIKVICRSCFIENYVINVFCKTGKVCSITFQGFNMKGGTIKLNNISMTLRNALLEKVYIGGFSIKNPSNGYNEIYFEDSTISCYDILKCGLYFTNISATKVAFETSYIYNFVIDISVGQLMLILMNSHVIMPEIFKVKVTNIEYLKIPAIIEFYNVSVVKNRMTEPGSLKYVIVFDLTNPWIVIRDSKFDGIHLNIQSKRLKFDPEFFSLLLANSRLTNSIHVGEGGALAITSEVQDSQVMISDCIFTDNFAVKGLGSLKGQGGGLYVGGYSLSLTMTNSILKDNEASDSGLAMYTTEGVNVAIENTTFQHVINVPIQLSIFFVNGKISKFHGLFKIYNPSPNTFDVPIDVFYFGQGAKLNINTYCPKFYNHHVEHMPMSLQSRSISGVKYRCNPCTDYYYTTGMENNTLVFNRETTMSNEELNVKTSCLSCPYGAFCTGNNVIPRPNYWGYWYKGELVFQQCPADYCCPGSGNITCNVYNYCPSNRTGILCGTCQEGFSTSILTVACMPNNKCGKDEWFWPVAILAAICYMTSVTRKLTCSGLKKLANFWSS